MHCAPIFVDFICHLLAACLGCPAYIFWFILSLGCCFLFLFLFLFHSFSLICIVYGFFIPIWSCAHSCNWKYMILSTEYCLSNIYFYGKKAILFYKKRSSTEYRFFPFCLKGFLESVSCILVILILSILSTLFIVCPIICSLCTAISCFCEVYRLLLSIFLFLF